MEQGLRTLVNAIVAGDVQQFLRLLSECPSLASATFSEGATRQVSTPSFLPAIGHYIYAGDTALHFAAASYRADMAKKLMEAGAVVRARNRRGSEPLHAAAFGSPSSLWWDPKAQAATIVCLIEAGADPNAQNKDGATPLHRAVRTRCAGAVQTLIGCGADPAIRNKSGSTPAQLAGHNTGRSGSGSPAAKAQQAEIVRLFQNAAGFVDV